MLWMGIQYARVIGSVTKVATAKISPEALGSFTRADAQEKAKQDMPDMLSLEFYVFDNRHGKLPR